MGTILEFPSQKARVRASLELAVKNVLKNYHSEDTYEEKLKAAMDIFDQYLLVEGIERMTVNLPDSEPLSKIQTECVHAAFLDVQKRFVDILRNATKDLILLKFSAIDLESR